jgi:hypothetical protein
MHKLKELAMMCAGIAAYWVVWFWWPKSDRDGLTSREKFGLYFVGIAAVLGTVVIL